MNYLLAAVNAKYIHSNLGVYSLKAYALQETGQAGQRIQIGEYTINHSRQFILADIYRKKPDVVGFSCYIWNIEYVSALISDLSKILPQTKIWLGGPEVSYNSEEILQKFPQVTGVMVGEGEETFAWLVRFYEQGGITLEEISGITYRKEDGSLQICANKPRPPMDLNRIPFPYGDLEGKEMAHRILYYESSRGCPYSCSYCLSSIDKSVRFRDLEVVKKELQFFLDRNVPQVKFVDRTFNCKKSHAMEIWSYIAEHDNGYTNFHFEIAGDLLDEDAIDLFKRMRPGLIQLEIGVQTANRKTLEAICRKTDLDKLGRMAARVREGKNIHQHLDLIAGLPYEDLESFRSSFDRVYRMKPDQLQLGFLKVLKGSYMEEQKENYGLLAGALPPYEVLSTRWLSFADILRLKQIEEMVEVYYNSSQFTWTMEYVNKLEDRPIRMFEELAEWYSFHGLWEVKHSRQARYEIFWNWIRFRFPDEEEAFRDRLTVDFYLRETAKSRPAFSKDQSEFKEAFRLFYQREARERKFLDRYEGYDSRQLAHMTHIEVLQDKRALLFDYRRRDPLNDNAAMFEICLPEP